MPVLSFRESDVAAQPIRLRRYTVAEHLATSWERKQDVQENEDRQQRQVQGAYRVNPTLIHVNTSFRDMICV